MSGIPQSAANAFTVSRISRSSSLRRASISRRSPRYGGPGLMGVVIGARLLPVPVRSPRCRGEQPGLPSGLGAGDAGPNEVIDEHPRSAMDRGRATGGERGSVDRARVALVVLEVEGGKFPGNGSHDAI